MLFTNLEDHGGNFRDALDYEFSQADSVMIASGYCSLTILETFRANFISIAKNGGSAKLLLGMAFYEGLSKKQIALATELDEELRGLSNLSGVYVARGRRYHGKIYKFANRQKTSLYVGSSNFSCSGTKKYIECTLPVISDEQKVAVFDFMDELYSEKFSVGIHKVDLTVKGKVKPFTNNFDKSWKAVGHHQRDDLDLNQLPKFDYCLKRIVEKERSNLNIYFGKGRVNKSSGKVSPRPWYEIELIATKDLRTNHNYPTGHFRAFTDDGLIIPMQTNGDGYKNIRSTGSLQVFGKWLKGKLQKSGALEIHQPVTLDTLKEYGNDKITFYKINEQDYYIKF
jgi:hypothetical protein